MIRKQKKLENKNLAKEQKKQKKLEKKQKRKERIPVKRVGINKKSVIILWIVFIGAFLFAIYKNFTAIDIHTIHEKEVIKHDIVDTNGIESYVKEFATLYHSWDNNKDSLDNRQTALSNYLTDDLLSLNEDMIRSDVPNSSKVTDVSIWDLMKISNNEYRVVYKVTQKINGLRPTDITSNTSTDTPAEGGQITEYEMREQEKAEAKAAPTKEQSVQKQKFTVTASYEIVVYVDNNKNRVIIKNPTIYHAEGKTNYQPKLLESDMTITSSEQEEIITFLETFFKLYPTADKEELAYYVKNEVLKPIYCDSLVFEKIDRAVFTKTDKGIEVNFVVKYLNQTTKVKELCQYDLELEKADNWSIVKNKQ